MSKTIEMAVTCGLGNQMFQYAMGRALSVRLGMPLVLDISLVTRWEPCFRPPGVTDPLWGFDLRFFRLGQQRILNLPFLLWRVRNKFVKGLAHYGIGSKRVVKEISLRFEPEFLRISSPCFLIGHWEDGRYFESVADQLRQEFTVVPSQDARSAECQARIRRVKSVGLHVRRGDNVTNPGSAAFHGTCPKEYYDDALRLILSRLGSDVELFVFSDDIEWTRENIRYPLTTTYVDWNAKRNYEDLRLMSACSALVIANSTFSWWAGWLNPNPKKLVVAPKRWFLDPEAASDLPSSPWLIAL